MGLKRRSSNRFQAAIWPGFVDAMTGLLLVLMFVLTVFTVMQFALRDTITGQADELDALGGEIERLSRALGLERARGVDLESEIGSLGAQLAEARDLAEARAGRIESLTEERAAQDRALDAARSRIGEAEDRIA
ncbi:hypothetical protein NHG85_14955, partial [Limimaricola sp. ASW11-118]|nr:hypothetical protein [Limimaricola litoreus]